MGITNLGAVSMSAGGVYNSETVYKKYKVVSANGGSYMYINPTPAAGVPLTDTSHWQQIASMGGQDLVDAAVAARDAAQGHKDAAAAYAAQLAAGIGSPAGKFANLAAVNAANPAHDRTYLTEDDWKIALWDEIAQVFVAGGVYQAAQLEDGSVSTSKLSSVTIRKSANRLNTADADYLPGYYAQANGAIFDNASYNLTGFIQVEPGDVVIPTIHRSDMKARFHSSFRMLAAYNSAKIIQTASGSGVEIASYTVPEGIYYIRATLYASSAALSPMIEVTKDGVYSAYYEPFYADQHAILSAAVEPVPTEMISNEAQTAIGIAPNNANILFGGDFTDTGFIATDWSLADGVLSSPAVPTIAKVAEYTSKYIVLDSDTIVMRVIPKTLAGLIFYIVRDCNEATVASRIDYINFETGDIGFLNACGDVSALASAPTVRKTEVTGHTFIADREYTIVSERKNGNESTLTITDTLTLDEYTVTSKSSYIGAAWGYRGFSCGGGAIDVTDFKVYSTQPVSPKLMIIGDSFVEGNSIWTSSDEDTVKDLRYSALIRDALSGNVMICGQGGAKTYHVMQWYEQYLKYFRPKYVFLAIGTNNSVYADWLEQYRPIIRKIEEYGSTPILATITIRTDADYAAFRAAANTWIRQSGYRYVDFCKITTANFDDATQNTALFNADKIHPTVECHALMYKKFKQSVPELFL